MRTAEEREAERVALHEQFPSQAGHIGPLGFEMSLSNSMYEKLYWVGKPWRRLEIIVHDLVWKGEIDKQARTWNLDLHLGFRDWGMTWSLFHSPGADYSDDRP